MGMAKKNAERTVVSRKRYQQREAWGHHQKGGWSQKPVNHGRVEMSGNPEKMEGEELTVGKMIHLECPPEECHQLRSNSVNADADASLPVHHDMSEYALYALKHS
jgi:hypothetical protein